jgi:hypothetical protein
VYAYALIHKQTKKRDKERKRKREKERKERKKKTRGAHLPDVVSFFYKL